MAVGEWCAVVPPEGALRRLTLAQSAISVNAPHFTEAAARRAATARFADTVAQQVALSAPMGAAR
jgi:hypothetical protein